MDKDIRKKLDELWDKLLTISDNRDFLLAITNTVERKEDIENIMRYIDDGDDVTEKTLALLAIYLSNQKKPKTYEEILREA